MSMRSLVHALKFPVTARMHGDIGFNPDLGAHSRGGDVSEEGSHMADCMLLTGQLTYHSTEPLHSQKPLIVSALTKATDCICIHKSH